MKSSKIIDRILEAIRRSRTLCIVGHVRPDGDCVGSQLGLALALKKQGKEVLCWNEDPIPNKLAFLDPDGLMQRPQPDLHFDCVIATDCATAERLGSIGPCIQNRDLLVNIDHHPSNSRYEDLNWISSRKPSTGELIFRLLSVANWPVTPAIANCLFTAVSTDTGSFQYPTTQPETYYVAGKLVERGANLATICDEVYQSYSLSRVRLLQHVFNSFRLTANNQIAYFWLKPHDYSRTGAESNDAEGLIDHIRAIKPVIVACVFEELGDDVVRISLRSKSQRINVDDIARQFGGGGHPAAAGARIHGKSPSVQRRVINSLKQALASAA